MLLFVEVVLHIVCSGAILRWELLIRFKQQARGACDAGHSRECETVFREDHILSYAANGRSSVKWREPSMVILEHS